VNDQKALAAMRRIIRQRWVHRVGMKQSDRAMSII
jgi:hypothetical protein